jgi:hypothetical protein
MQATARQTRQAAGVKLDAARKHRAALGAQLTPKSPMMLVDWYMSALHAEEAARAEYGVALDAERHAQMRAAYLI